MNKKAKFSLDMTFLGIFLAISFVIVIIFLMRMTPENVSDNAACKTSIELKHTFNIKGAVNILPVELSCKTQYVCFTSGLMQDCKTNFGAGEKVKNINVGKSPEKLLGELARLQYSCWDMLGEGKRDYYPRTFDFTRTYCSPCYRFAFSDELKKEIQEIKYTDYLNYLATHNTPGEEKVSYLYYLFKISDPSLVYFHKEYNSLSKIDTNKEYAIMALTYKDGWMKTILGSTIGLIGGGVIAYFTGGLAIPILAMAGTTTLGTIGGNAITDDLRISPPQPFEYGGETFKKLNCEIDFIK